MREDGAALLDGGQPQRVGVQVVGVSGEFARDVAGEDADLAEPHREVGQDRVMGADRVQRALGGRDHGARVDALGVLRVPGEARVREGGRGGERFGVAQAFGLGGEFDVLARQRLGRGDLLDAEAEQVRLLGAFPGAGGQFVELLGHVPQPAVRGAVLHQRPGDGVARVPVQGLALPRRAQQALLVGLAVHRDELVGEFTEQPDRHAPAADVRARAPSAETVRLISRAPSSSSAPASTARTAAGAPGSRLIRPSTTACLAPIRTSAGSARPPSSSPRLVTTMVLPAPVSPVTAVKPGDSSTTASSMTPSDRIRISSNTDTTIRGFGWPWDRPGYPFA